MGFGDHGGFASKPRASYTEVLQLMILLNKFWGMNIVLRFPSVLSIGVSLSVYSVLFLFLATKKPHHDNCLDFPFRLSFDNVRGWLQVVWSVLFRFLVLRKVGGVEDVVDLPRGWQLKLIRHMA